MRRCCFFFFGLTRCESMAPISAAPSGLSAPSSEAAGAAGFGAAFAIGLGAAEGVGFLGAGRATPPEGPPAVANPLSPDHRFQRTSSGLALKIEEYVPLTIPISNAETNNRITGPPSIKRARSVIITVPDVF